MGGAQSLHTNSRDEALALPTEDSVRIALRTQQIIARESGAADSIDPLGGSYFVERLTDELETRAKAVIDAVDRRGGAIKAIEEGFIQRQIQESAYVAQKRIDAGQDAVVGVNCYRVENEAAPETLRVDPATEAEQIRSVTAVKAGRDKARVAATLAALRAAAAGPDNLLPPILEAVRAYASLGEIADVLRSAFGEYRERVIL